MYFIAKLIILSILTGAVLSADQDAENGVPMEEGGSQVPRQTFEPETEPSSRGEAEKFDPILSNWKKDYERLFSLDKQEKLSPQETYNLLIKLGSESYELYLSEGVDEEWLEKARKLRDLVIATYTPDDDKVRPHFVFVEVECNSFTFADINSLLAEYSQFELSIVPYIERQRDELWNSCKKKFAKDSYESSELLTEDQRAKLTALVEQVRSENGISDRMLVPGIRSYVKLMMEKSANDLTVRDAFEEFVKKLCTKAQSTLSGLDDMDEILKQLPERSMKSSTMRWLRARKICSKIMENADTLEVAVEKSAQP